MAHDHHETDVCAANAAVVTVSDTRGTDDDPSGDLIAQLLTGAGHTVKHRSHVKDDPKAIKRAFDWLIADGVDLVITTGGTGIALRDITYEVIERMLDKKLDGFGETFRRLSWDEIGPRAILSRALAGTMGPTLIFALPGSTKAVRLAMEQIILPVASHAVGLLK
jgi:molybdenum cofactor biosynthesis protein B